MSKRADAPYIKRMSKILPIVTDWAYVPLFLLDKDTHIAQEAEKIRNTLGSEEKDFTKLMDDMCMYSPSPDFLFLDKTVNINIKTDQVVELKHNYFYVSVQSKKEIKTINILYPTQSDGLIWFAIVKQDNMEYLARLMQAKGTKDEVWSAEGVEEGEFEYKGTNDIEEIKIFMGALLIKVASTIRAVGHSDLYPIEQRGVQHRKVHAKKTWQRSDLATIVYLNKLPTEHRESRGGEHNSPHPHPRRGTWRRLDNERFKKHPMYKSKIWIKPSWVGPKKSTVQNITYKVL